MSLTNNVDSVSTVNKNVSLPLVRFELQDASPLFYENNRKSLIVEGFACSSGTTTISTKMARK
jgi:hypothetical protein